MQAPAIQKYVWILEHIPKSLDNILDRVKYWCFCIDMCVSNNKVSSVPNICALSIINHIKRQIFSRSFLKKI
jgi:hypothetical protein